MRYMGGALFWIGLGLIALGLLAPHMGVQNYWSPEPPNLAAEAVSRIVLTNLGGLSLVAGCILWAAAQIVDAIASLPKTPSSLD